MSTKQIKQALVVDDQENWRDVFKMFLKNEGVWVTETNNFKDAKELFQKESFNIIISDVRLVDRETFNTEGIDFLNFVKDNKPSTKFIVTTGYPESIGNKHPPRADAYFLKVPPEGNFDSKYFKEKIRELLNE